MWKLPLCLVACKLRNCMVIELYIGTYILVLVYMFTAQSLTISYGRTLRRIFRGSGKGKQRSAFDYPNVYTRFFVCSSVQWWQWNDETPFNSSSIVLRRVCSWEIYSIDRQIEQSKQSYFAAQLASSAGWYEGKNDYVPFARYMLGVVVAAYREYKTKKFSVLLDSWHYLW